MLLQGTFIKLPPYLIDVHASVCLQSNEQVVLSQNQTLEITNIFAVGPDFKAPQGAFLGVRFMKVSEK